MLKDFDFKSVNKIAVMGGAFDPIHFGHLVTGETVSNKFDVEKVIYMPLGDAPHKKMKGAAAIDRYMMAKTATDDNDAFEISALEINRGGKTYTVDTIAEIKEINPDIKIYFIMGADEILAIESWREPERLLRMCSFIAVTRPGFTEEDVKEQTDMLKAKYGCDIYFTEVPALDISSSDLRRRVGKGESIKYLVPKEVEKYISEHNLYKE